MLIARYVVKLINEHYYYYYLYFATVPVGELKIA